MRREKDKEVKRGGEDVMKWGDEEQGERSYFSLLDRANIAALVHAISNSITMARLLLRCGVDNGKFSC